MDPPAQARKSQNIGRGTAAERITTLASSAANRLCADCRSKEVDHVSVNLGIFLCGRCSAVHCTLGGVFTNVASLSAKEWTEDDLMSIASKGNEEANKFWEAKIPTFYMRPIESPSNEETKISSDVDVVHPIKAIFCCSSSPFPPQYNSSFIRENFIKAKYDRREFIPGSMPLQFVTQGWLHKSNPAKKERWLLRWFVLSDNNLSYFHNKTDSYASEVLPVSDLTVNFVEDGKKRGHGALIRVPERECKIWHEEISEIISWIHCLRQAQEQFNKENSEPSHEKELGNIIMNPQALQNPDIEGYLVKQGGSIKTWKKRWFVLKDNYLFYFGEKGDENPKGILCLKEGSVERCSADVGRNFAFSIKTPDRQYFMCAMNEMEEKAWIDAVARKVGQTWSGAMRMSGYYSSPTPDRKSTSQSDIPQSGAD